MQRRRMRRGRRQTDDDAEPVLYCISSLLYDEYMVICTYPQFSLSQKGFTCKNTGKAPTLYQDSILVPTPIYNMGVTKFAIFPLNT